MKWFLNRCGRHRQSICLLASGALSGPERSRVENHLAACADCRKYCDEIKKMAVPLANWEGNFRHIEPDQIIRMRWAKAVEAAAEPAPVRRPTPIMAIIEWWHDMIWPCRRIWAGLVVGWVVILAVNFSMRDNSQTKAMKSSPPSPEMIMAFQQQERLLAELIGPSETHNAEPPKLFLPQPRSQRRIGLLTACV
jgi:anti-sigma factor RsiW